MVCAGKLQYINLLDIRGFTLYPCLCNLYIHDSFIYGVGVTYFVLDIRNLSKYIQGAPKLHTLLKSIYHISCVLHLILTINQSNFLVDTKQVSMTFILHSIYSFCQFV